MKNSDPASVIIEILIVRYFKCFHLNIPEASKGAHTAQIGFTRPRRVSAITYYRYIGTKCTDRVSIVQLFISRIQHYQAGRKHALECKHSLIDLGV